ncbi:MAG TPA: patatin, partial [Lachnoclostridium sp.]|nr:patatin [Lachnoclostridium sp.]
KEDWDYKDMYLGLLEDLAKRLKVKRFQIYTVDQLMEEIRKKLRSLDKVKPQQQGI